MSPLILSLFGLLGCQSEPEPWARAFVMEDLADGVGGPKAMADVGDFIIENEHLKLAITGGHTSIGPSIYGGTLIDVDRNRSSGAWTGGAGNDRFAEMFPTVSMNVSLADEETEVFILNDGADGEAAIVRVQSEKTGFLELLNALWAFVGNPEYEIVTDYILEPGAEHLLIRTTAWFSDGGDVPEQTDVLVGSTEPLPLLDLALETGVVFGDFFLQGGDVDVFAPGIGFDEDGAVYEWSLEGRNTFADPAQMDYIGGAADGVSYVLATLDGGDVFVPLFTSSQTAAFAVGVEGDGSSARFPVGTAFTYERVLGVGHGDVGSALDGVLAARGEVVGEVTGYVVAADDNDPVSGAYVFVYEAGAERPWSQWTTDVSLEDDAADGSFGGTLPPGDWELQVHEEGRPTGERVPITVTADGDTQLTLTAPRTGDVSFRIVDEAGITVPGKITIFPAKGEASRDPILGDGYLSGDIEGVLFAAYGEAQTLLPPGKYEAWASRGPEYEVGVAAFEIDGSQSLDLELQVIRSVDTSGWISADFHVHAQPSHDSGVTLPQRVATMMSEHVEFLVGTDHDYITDYRPVIEDMGVEQWITAAVGLESTPIEYGHFIGFPLRHDYLEQNGGAFNWTGLVPEEILEELVALGDGTEPPVTFVAHPRDGILGYFDQYGFDLYRDPKTLDGPEPGDNEKDLVDPPITTIGSEVLTAEEFTLEFDALELLNGKRFEILRVPTRDELADYNDAYAQDPSTDVVTAYDIVQRTIAEQDDLIAGAYRLNEILNPDPKDPPPEDEWTYNLGEGGRGQIDDWFSLLNLGYRFTAMGNSDTHGTTSTESGCPRNYVASVTDDPAFVRAEDVAQAVKDGRVITSYGPFIRFWADGDPDITVGSEYVTSGPVEFTIEVQSPTWFNVDRVELYRNGEIIQEWDNLAPGGSNPDIINLAETIEDDPEGDAWYVVIAMGDDDLSPLFTPVDIPPVHLQDVVLEALGDVDALSSFLSAAPKSPLTYPVYPFALTNPIWIDRDGDGFDAPGLPDWWVTPQPITQASEDTGATE